MSPDEEDFRTELEKSVKKTTVEPLLNFSVSSSSDVYVGSANTLWQRYNYSIALFMSVIFPFT